MTFEISESGIRVVEVTNQSLGYCPDADSWPAVAAALERAGISHPDRFTTELIFRRCRECGITDVVKDAWYRCAVCEADLDLTWNFEHAGLGPK